MEPRFALLFSIAILVQVGLHARYGGFALPRSRFLGQAALYLLIAGILSSSFGWWGLIWILGHPALGLLAHVTWCRNNGIEWRTCEPREDYLRKVPWNARDQAAIRKG